MAEALDADAFEADALEADALEAAVGGVAFEAEQIDLGGAELLGPARRRRKLEKHSDLHTKALHAGRDKWHLKRKLAAAEAATQHGSAVVQALSLTLPEAAMST